MLFLSIAVVLAAVLAIGATRVFRQRVRSRAQTIPTLKENAALPQRPMPLAERTRSRYGNELEALARRFPEAPVETLREAERLVGRILRDRGYPYLDPNLRPEAVAEHFPTIAGEYRTARTVMQRFDSGKSVPTEEMREALDNYHAIASGLLEPE
ncbi:MAG: hypothetical protein ACRENA_14665 [Vulcanimicrobiaceae bacterium]